MVAYIAVALPMLFCPVAKLLEMVSPTENIKALYIQMQYGLAALLIVSSIIFLFEIHLKKLMNKKFLTLLILGILLMAWLLVSYFSKIGGIGSVYILILTFSGVLLLIFSCRYTIFPEIEFSLDGIIENIEDRVAVFDLNGNLVDMNIRALQKELNLLEQNTLLKFLEKLNQSATQDVLDMQQIVLLQNDSYENEICFEVDGDCTYYNFSAYAITNKKREKIGTVCTLRDITGSKLISLELDNKNKELKNLNKELGNYIKIADSLAEEKERAEIAREINSTIGQKLTEILSVLEVIKLTNSKDSDVFERPLNEAIESCREVLSEIRIVVSKLMPDNDRGGK